MDFAFFRFRRGARGVRLGRWLGTSGPPPDVDGAIALEDGSGFWAWSSADTVILWS